MNESPAVASGFSRTFVAVMIAAGISATPMAQRPDSSSLPQTRTVWDGVFNLTQASRGESAYTTHCAGCHRDDLTGYDGLLRGQRFMDKYREASLHLLYDKTKTTMPRHAAGTLSDETYVDIVSYVLSSNEFPPGDDELRVDDLRHVRLVGKGGPEPVPAFSLIRVVGCLERRADLWVLANTTDPVRTPNPRPTSDDRAIETTPGTATFGLLVSPAYAPENHLGRVVEVRGFLIRRASDDRINITSIETVGQACGA